MAIVSGKNAIISNSVRQKFSLPNRFGGAIFGLSKFGHKNIYAGIYQQRKGIKGKITVIEKFYRPTNPQSVAQQANRQKYADSVSAWQGMTDEQKEPYRQRAKSLPYSGYNLFQKEYILSH